MLFQFHEKYKLILNKQIYDTMTSYIFHNLTCSLTQNKEKKNFAIHMKQVNMLNTFHIQSQ